MSDPCQEYCPELDATDFSAEQVARVLTWYGQAERLARIHELQLAWLAITDQPRRYTPEVQLYLIGRMATLAFGPEPAGGGDE